MLELKESLEEGVNNKLEINIVGIRKTQKLVHNVILRAKGFSLRWV